MAETTARFALHRDGDDRKMAFRIIGGHEGLPFPLPGSGICLLPGTSDVSSPLSLAPKHERASVEAESPSILYGDFLFKEKQEPESPASKS